MEDEVCQRAPVGARNDENVKRLCQLITLDRRLTLRMISYELQLNKSIHEILHKM